LIMLASVAVEEAPIFGRFPGTFLSDSNT